MKKFSHRFTVSAPIEKVAAFHNDARALKILTPFPLWVQIHEVEPLAENSRAEFTMWAGPIPLRWEALHTHVSDQGFTDTQVNGPYRYWVHSHQFVALNAHSTEIIDEVSAIYGDGFFWGLITRLMWIGLPILFAFRARRTRAFLKNES